MVRGLLLSGLSAGVVAVGWAWVVQGAPGGGSAAAGWLLTMLLMLGALVGIKLVVGLSGILPLLGAVLVLTATIIVMAAARAVLLDVDWVLRPTFALAAGGTVVLGQTGVVIGLLGSRSPLFEDAA